jgi:hypothetical protein
MHTHGGAEQQIPPQATVMMLGSPDLLYVPTTRTGVGYKIVFAPMDFFMSSLPIIGLAATKLLALFRHSAAVFNSTQSTQNIKRNPRRTWEVLWPGTDVPKPQEFRRNLGARAIFNAFLMIPFLEFVTFGESLSMLPIHGRLLHSTCWIKITGFSHATDLTLQSKRYFPCVPL